MTKHEIELMKVNAIAEQTGKTRDQVVSDAIDMLYREVISHDEK